MSNSIAKDFKFFSLLRFAAPTIIMMVFMSLYTIVDGIFISRLLGTNALSSANIVYPVLNLVIAVGVMLASGGSAIIARKFGENNSEEAREDFSLLIIVGIAAGFVIMAAGNLFIEPIARMLGATDVLLADAVSYLSVSLFLAPACILQLLFQTFFVTAGKPNLGLLLTIGGGLANMVLDYVFMGPLQMGIGGAALATGIGQLVPAASGFIYFFFVKGSLHITKPKFRGSVIIESCLNGSSEMVTNISAAVVTYLFNIMMLKFLGEPGVAAITIVLYGQFLFNAMYMGFSVYRGNLYACGNEDIRDSTKRILPLLVQLYLCRYQYLRIRDVYRILQREDISGRLFRMHLRIHRGEHTGAAVSYRCKRHLAVRTRRRVHDCLPVRLFLLQETERLPLYLT